MKNIVLVIALTLTGGITWAKGPTMKEDIESLQSMFIATVDVYGPQLERCGRRADREKIFDSVKFVYSGYRRLHKSFPTVPPSLDAQLAQRLQNHCNIVGCSTPFGNECETKQADGSDSVMSYYDYRVTEMKRRLKAAGLNASTSPTDHSQNAGSATSCPNSAQSYQDAYERARRVSDLVCLQKALQRELQ